MASSSAGVTSDARYKRSIPCAAAARATAAAAAAASRPLRRRRAGVRRCRDSSPSLLDDSASPRGPPPRPPRPRPRVAPRPRPRRAPRISLRLTDAAGAGSKSTPDKKRDATAAVIAMPTPPPAVRARLDSAALASPELGVTDNAGERHFASHPICAHQNTAPRNLAVPMQRGSSKRLHRRWRRSSKRRRQCKRLRRRRRTLRSRSRQANVEEEHFAANPARLTSE